MMRLFRHATIYCDGGLPAPIKTWAGNLQKKMGWDIDTPPRGPARATHFTKMWQRGL